MKKSSFYKNVRVCLDVHVYECVVTNDFSNVPMRLNRLVNILFYSIHLCVRQIYSWNEKKDFSLKVNTRKFICAILYLGHANITKY